MTPIPTKKLQIMSGKYTLGLKKDRARGMKICFDWRPYERRTPEARRDYDKLVLSIFHNGIQKPVISWYDKYTGTDHILIGQRRAEIATRMGQLYINSIQILEDVTQWTREDIKRLNALKEEIGEYEY